MRIYAVIPTHNRPEQLADLLATIPPDVHVLVIDNASEPPVFEHEAFAKRKRGWEVVRDEEQPPNLSRLWNIGLDWAAGLEYAAAIRRGVPADEYAVATLNDDVLLPKNLLSVLAGELLTHNVDIAFPGGVEEDCWVNKRPWPDKPFPGVALRLTGWCFVVRGKSGLRADERLHWWCGDDDLQASAVRSGRGTVRVGLTQARAAGLRHRHPDESTTGVLREQAAIDMTTFIQKWGQRPW